jgi:hypothetical protein
VNERRSVLVTVAVVVAVAIGWLLLAGPGRGPSAERTGAAFNTGDRNALGAAPVGRGAQPSAPDPTVNFTDAGAVATAYVHAAYSLQATDADRTNRRAVPYAAPSTPPNEVGVLALDTPPQGRRTDAVVTDVTRVDGEPTDTRRGYLVGYHDVTLPAEAPQPSASDPSVTATRRQTRYLLLTKQFDGRWLVASDTTNAQVGAP